MRLFSILVLALTLTVTAFPQYHQKALDRAREIKLLQDDREAVQKAFHEFVLDGSDETTDDFSFDGTSIEVTYSSGKCDEDEEEIWSAPEGRVIRIEILSEKELKAEDFAQELSGLMKEQKYADVESQIIYHDKKRGVAFEVDGDDIEKIILFPSVSGKPKVCSFKSAREFVSEKSWFGKTKLEDRKGIYCGNKPANVTALALSHEVVSGTTAKEIKIETTAVDLENDVLTYVYNITAGRIIGRGVKVVWDLTGVPSGTYTITAGVDDGCGLCGATMTKTIVVE